MGGEIPADSQQLARSLPPPVSCAWEGDPCRQPAIGPLPPSAQKHCKMGGGDPHSADVGLLLSPSRP
ncbi:hypothetical protein FKM82_028229 [Ascaphus truei]